MCVTTKQGRIKDNRITTFQRRRSISTTIVLIGVKMNDIKRCCICHRPAEILVCNDSDTASSTFWVCNQCNIYFLQKKYIDKISTLENAFELSEKENISIPYAINVVLGKYSIREAKRRFKLKKKEKEGKSVDVFDLGKIVPGNFGSKQK